MIILFQDVSGWKLRKIVKDWMQAQKRNSYILSLTIRTSNCSGAEQLGSTVQIRPNNINNKRLRELALIVFEIRDHFSRNKCRNIYLATLAAADNTQPKNINIYTNRISRMN